VRCMELPQGVRVRAVRCRLADAGEVVLRLQAPIIATGNFGYNGRLP
jgi:hypothetical protein